MATTSRLVGASWLIHSLFCRKIRKPNFIWILWNWNRFLGRFFSWDIFREKNKKIFRLFVLFIKSFDWKTEFTHSLLLTESSRSIGLQCKFKRRFSQPLATGFKQMTRFFWSSWEVFFSNSEIAAFPNSGRQFVFWIHVSEVILNRAYTSMW